MRINSLCALELGTVLFLAMRSDLWVNAQNTLVTLYPIKYMMQGTQESIVSHCWQADIDKNIISFQVCDKSAPLQQFLLSTNGLLVAGSNPYRCVVVSSEDSTFMFLSVCDPRAPGQLWQVNGPDVPMPVAINNDVAICPRPCNAVTSTICGYRFDVSGGPGTPTSTCSTLGDGSQQNSAFSAIIIEATGSYAKYNPTSDPLFPTVVSNESGINETDRFGNSSSRISTGALLGITSGILFCLCFFVCGAGIYLHKRRRQQNTIRKELVQQVQSTPAQHIYNQDTFVSKPDNAYQRKCQYSGSFSSIPFSTSYSNIINLPPAGYSTNSSDMSINQSPLSQHHCQCQSHSNSKSMSNRSSPVDRGQSLWVSGPQTLTPTLEPLCQRDLHDSTISGFGATTIILECDHAENNEDIVMVGSETALGDWDPANAPVMQRQSSNSKLFLLTVSNSDDEPIPYRFARISKDTRSVVWMQGDNLLLKQTAEDTEVAFSWVL